MGGMSRQSRYAHAAVLRNGAKKSMDEKADVSYFVQQIELAKQRLEKAQKDGAEKQIAKEEEILNNLMQTYKRMQK